MQLDLKSVLIIGALIVLLVLAGGAGTQLGRMATVATYSQEIKTKDAKILTLTTEKAALAAEIAANNSAIAVAEAKSLAAMKAQSMAEQHARDLALLSEERMKKLDKALVNAVTVSEVLDRYWELRK